MDTSTLFALGVALIFAGIIIIIAAGLLLLIRRAEGNAKVKGGGAIIIGPFPIIFGTDKESVKVILMLSLALTTVAIVAMVVYHLMSR